MLLVQLVHQFCTVWMDLIGLIQTLPVKATYGVPNILTSWAGDAVWNGQVWIAVGSNPNGEETVAVSSDGINWKSHGYITVPTLGPTPDVSYGGTSVIWVPPFNSWYSTSNDPLNSIMSGNVHGGGIEWTAIGGVTVGGTITLTVPGRSGGYSGLDIDISDDTGAISTNSVISIPDGFAGYSGGNYYVVEISGGAINITANLSGGSIVHPTNTGYAEFVNYNDAQLFNGRGNGLAWNGNSTNPVIVAVGDDRNGHSIFVSSDGASFASPSTYPANGLGSGLAVASNNIRFVAVGLTYQHDSIISLSLIHI